MDEKIEMMPGMGYFQQNKKCYLNRRLNSCLKDLKLILTNPDN